MPFSARRRALLVCKPCSVGANCQRDAPGLTQFLDFRITLTQALPNEVMGKQCIARHALIQRICHSGPSQTAHAEKEVSMKQFPVTSRRIASLVGLVVVAVLFPTLHCPSATGQKFERVDTDAVL